MPTWTSARSVAATTSKKLQNMFCKETRAALLQIIDASTSRADAVERCRAATADGNIPAYAFGWIDDTFADNKDEHEDNGGYNADQPGYVPPPQLVDEHPDDHYGDHLT